MIRRFGTPPEPARRYKHRPGVYAVILAGEDVLVTRQEPVGRMAEPEIQLPGGGIDPGESPLTALHREVMEETGWRIATPRRLGAFRRFAYMPDYDLYAEKLCTIYVASAVRPLCAPSEPGHTAIWMPREAALQVLANSGDRFFLSRALL
ncbi:NUDIX hydrolase [Cognatishimia maritima]|uniref:8-oxo-dGTP diphosphatase n=1 Tax=Cognatishimia maritima TaxID=870908 RepID=A0A1M5PCQ8_9RHOB|nr:NUDIX hydrolase [Cognatishimia maritima]SHG99033.1 8-oxo-dGTP diphosphatase [Cognatishimia maritima]